MKSADTRWTSAESEARSTEYKPKSAESRMPIRAPWTHSIMKTDEKPRETGKTGITGF